MGSDTKAAITKAAAAVGNGADFAIRGRAAAMLADAIDAHVRALLAAALVPAAKAEAGPSILDAIAASPLGKARLQQTGETWPPAAKPEATGAPIGPARLPLAIRPGEGSPWAFITEFEPQDAGQYSKVDYIRADVAEREAAELRRQIDTRDQTVLRLGEELVAALARVAEVEAIANAACDELERARDSFEDAYLDDESETDLLAAKHTADMVLQDCRRRLAPAQPPEVITSAAVEPAGQAMRGNTKVGGGR